jgi:hypothetical protein
MEFVFVENNISGVHDIVCTIHCKVNNLVRGLPESAMTDSYYYLVSVVLKLICEAI